MNLLRIKSRGLKFVLLFNLIIACLIWWGGSSMLKANFQNPIFTSFIDSIPTITVEDNTVIDPIDQNTVIHLGAKPFLYIQTDRDYVGVGAIQDGLYLTRKSITILEQGNTLAVIELPDDTVISSEKVHQFFRNIILWIPVIFAVICLGYLWIFYLALVGVTALTNLLIKRFGKQAPLYCVWRCSTIAMLAVLICDFTLSFLGYSIPTLTIYGYPTMLSQLFVSWLVAVGLVCVETFNSNKTEKSETKTKQKKETK